MQVVAIDNRKLLPTMRDIIEVVALALGFMSWTMVGVSLQDKQWKKNSGDGGVVITNEIFENLWMACATDSMGTFDCYEFQSMLALPGKTGETMN